MLGSYSRIGLTNLTISLQNRKKSKYLMRLYLWRSCETALIVQTGERSWHGDSNSGQIDRLFKWRKNKSPQSDLLSVRWGWSNAWYGIRAANLRDCVINQERQTNTDVFCYLAQRSAKIGSGNLSPESSPRASGRLRVDCERKHQINLWSCSRERKV